MKSTINPYIILTLDIHNSTSINILVRNISGEILYINKVLNIGISDYVIRKNLIKELDYIVNTYNPDTLIFESNKLFIDKIQLYPDPFVLNNVIRGFGIQTSIEDKYYDKIKFILSLPYKEWSSRNTK